MNFDHKSNSRNLTKNKSVNKQSDKDLNKYFIKESKDNKKGTKKEDYKSIFHKDHLPATLGIMGAVMGLMLFSLQMNLSDREKRGKEAEILLVGELSEPIVVDHESVDQIIPDSWVVEASNVKSVLQHASVGGDIWEGLERLGYDNSNMFFDGRGNPGWQAKIDALETFTENNENNYEVFAQKLCYIDQTVDWNYYRYSMERLENTYPNELFVWWTIPIKSSDTEVNINLRNNYNNAVRNYVLVNNKILFDIADIESHKENGDTCLNNSNEEIMCSEYTDDGGHPNTLGGDRLAMAYWNLMARLAGWDGGDSEVAPTISPTITPTLNPTATPDISQENNCIFDNDCEDREQCNTSNVCEGLICPMYLPPSYECQRMEDHSCNWIKDETRNGDSCELGDKTGTCEEGECKYNLIEDDEEYSCIGSFENASKCLVTVASVLTADRESVLVSNCSGDWCEYKCNNNYIIDSSSQKCIFSENESGDSLDGTKLKIKLAGIGGSKENKNPVRTKLKFQVIFRRLVNNSEPFSQVVDFSYDSQSGNFISDKIAFENMEGLFDIKLMGLYHEWVRFDGLNLTSEMDLTSKTIKAGDLPYSFNLATNTFSYSETGKDGVANQGDLEALHYLLNQNQLTNDQLLMGDVNLDGTVNNMDRSLIRDGIIN